MVDRLLGLARLRLRRLAPALRSLAALMAIALWGCNGDDASFDAGHADASASDAAQPDAPLPDAGPCGAGQLLTGEYIDFHSTPQLFLGIPDATLTELGNPDNTHTTPPNGRVTMCIDGDTSIDYDHDTYLALRHEVSRDAAATGGFSNRGMTPAQYADLHGDTGVTAMAGEGIVIVEVRSYPSLDPRTDVSVSLSGTNRGSFVEDGAGDWTEGSQPMSRAHVAFMGVAENATYDLSWTAPQGVTCAGRSSITTDDQHSVTFTTIACQD